MKPATPSIAELLERRRMIADRIEFLESELCESPGPATEVILLPPIRHKRQELGRINMLIDKARNAS